MDLTKAEKDYLIKEISLELGAKFDGSHKNLIVPKCPHCGKENKFGIYVGKETERKKPFMSHCFHDNAGRTVGNNRKAGSDGLSYCRSGSKTGCPAPFPH